MNLKRGIVIGSLIAMSTFLLFGTGFANEVTVDFAKKEGIPVATSSVTIVKAEGIVDGNGFRVTGLVKIPHRLPMEGHLHAYMFSDKSELISENRHRIPGLHKAGKGVKRERFNFLISEFPNDTSKVFLEYHSPGHQES